MYSTRALGNTNTYQASIAGCRTIQQLIKKRNCKIFVQVQNLTMPGHANIFRGSNYKYLLGILYCSQFGSRLSPMTNITAYNAIKSISLTGPAFLRGEELPYSVNKCNLPCKLSASDSLLVRILFNAISMDGPIYQSPHCAINTRDDV